MYIEQETKSFISKSFSIYFFYQELDIYLKNEFWFSKNCIYIYIEINHGFSEPTYIYSFLHKLL